MERREGDKMAKVQRGRAKRRRKGRDGMEPGRLSYLFLSLAAQLGRAISR